MAVTMQMESSSSGSFIETEKLQYEVVEWSSYSSGYHPRLITENKPDDLCSRWLSDTGRPPQHITLQLSRPAIVTAIVFGKYTKPHACNVRKIKILGGMDIDSTITLHESELKNDGKEERHSIRHTLADGYFPCLFIKLVLLDTWGQTSFSLWYVELIGCNKPSIVRRAARKLKEFKKEETLRLCLKHLRQYDYKEAFSALKKQVQLEFEHPLLTQLHLSLVDNGDYNQTEDIFSQAMAEGLLDSHINNQPSQAFWQLLTSDGGSWPSIRGGHQLCLDSESQLIYMFGGWDGTNDLADLWIYNIRDKLWKCVCKDSSEQGGPSPRSCHKMCLDVDNQTLYIIGRYLDQETRTNLFTVTVPGDFYSYHIPSDKWELISSDTHSDNGPKLLYDHQMTFNPVNKTLYVFGGRVITSLLQEGIISGTYSGLYAYKCLEKEWVCLRPDYHHSIDIYPHLLVPRMAHTMVLHVEKQELYVLGGQKEKQPLCDMWVYSIKSDTSFPLADGSASQIPAAGYTVRATIDPISNELYLHMGMSRRDNDGDHFNNDSNSLWIFDMESKKWSKVVPTSPLPSPRFAHQLVFDQFNKAHYMFGGNPGGACNSNQLRLNDLWSMKIQKQTRDKVLHQCIYHIRKKRFEELVLSDSAQALKYLKSSIAECVDHNDPEQSQEFRGLTLQLFSEGKLFLNGKKLMNMFSADNAQTTREIRTQLFDKLSSLFPQDLSQPRQNLINFITY